MRNQKNWTIFFLSLGICLLIGFSSAISLFTEGFYSQETELWRSQCLGQDAMNLIVVVPFLALVSLLCLNKNALMTLIWSGAICYIIYTYLIYSFSVHFNPLFLCYSLILGLSFYSFIYFVAQDNKIIAEVKGSNLTRITGAYFVFSSVTFYYLWLAELVPAVFEHSVPLTVSRAGLFTNPVHVLDLAIVLPGVFITGISLLKGKPAGIVAAPVVLTFLLLMSVTVAGLAFIMKGRGQEASLTVALLLIGVAFLNIMLIGGHRNSLKKVYLD